MTMQLRQRMLHKLELASLSERNQEAYLRAVRQLAEHFHTSRELLTEQQLRNDFLGTDRSGLDGGDRLPSSALLRSVELRLTHPAAKRYPYGVLGRCGRRAS